MKSSPPNPVPWIRFDPVLALFLVMAAFLLFRHLGNGCLWQDEAETAVLAKNILRFGYPRAYDGVNRLNPSLPVAAGYAWTYHPWASMYLVALSFVLFGISTVSARLPGAVMGLLSIALAYRLVRRLFGEKNLARWTAFLLTTSVPFLLMMRQCRYYAPSVLFSLWTVWAYLRFRRGRPWAALEWTASLFLLFHVNHGVFVPVLMGLVLHLLIDRPLSRSQLQHSGWLLATVVLGILPFAFYLKTGQHHGAFSFEQLRHHAEFYFRQINRFLFPITGWAIVWLIGRPSWQGIRKWSLPLCLIGAGLLFLIPGPSQRHFRYLVFLIPWFLAIQAAWFERLAQKRWAVAIALLGLFVFTDAVYSLPSRFTSEPRPLRSLPWEYLGELTHPYRGPMDGVVELLRREARPGQTIKIPYEDHTLLFYTDLVVEPVIHPEDFTRETFPDWIVLRRDWLPGGFLESDYFSKIRQRYRQITLDAPDIPWQNRPDPGYHRFLTDHQAPLVIVFHKK